MTTNAILYKVEIAIDFVHGYYDIINEVFLTEHKLGFNYQSKSEGVHVFPLDEPRIKNCRHDKEPFDACPQPIVLPESVVAAVVRYFESKQAVTTAIRTCGIELRTNAKSDDEWDRRQEMHGKNVSAVQKWRSQQDPEVLRALAKHWVLFCDGEFVGINADKKALYDQIKGNSDGIRSWFQAVPE